MQAFDIGNITIHLLRQLHEVLLLSEAQKAS